MSDKLTNRTEGAKKRPSRADIAMLISLVVLSVIVFCVYRLLLNYYYFEFALIAYMLIETGFVFAYVIYNRGFSRRGVTRDMLPAEWSEEKKDRFIESSERRLSRSRWMLVVILAFLFTFMMEIIELWFVPIVQGWFGL